MFFTFCPLQAKQKYNDIEVDKVVSVYDGDTITVTIKEYPSIIGEKISIRVNGIDTPEIKGKCTKEKELGLKAKKFTVSFLTGAKEIQLTNVQRDKYFRIVADVYVNNVNLADMLIKENLAVPYFGGTKLKNWCE